MHVLHISREFLPLVGGTAKHIYEVSRRLQKRGIACRVLTLCYDLFDKSRKFPARETIDDIEVFRIKGWGHYKKPFPLEIPCFLFRWADIVHLHDPRFLLETTALFKFLFHFKIVLTSHGFILHTPQWKLIKKILIPTYYKFYFKNLLDAVICVSHQDLEYFKYWPIKRLFLIENGIDYRKYSQIERIPDPQCFLYFGRLDWNKGLDLLFLTLSELKDISWKLDIVGEGPKEVTLFLQKNAAKLGLTDRIKWHGFLPERELLSYLSRAQFCFFPSTYEGFGFTLLEAMAAGAICLANKIESFSYLIENNKNGFLLDFSSLPEAAKIIRDIIKLNKNNLEIISNEARKKASQYDWGKKVDNIEQLYNQIKALKS